MRPSVVRVSFLLATALYLFAPEASAQTGCRTGNCASAAPPVDCQSRATPRTLRVRMEGDGIGVPFRFTPTSPKIEPGECVEWFAATLTHNSSGSPCPDTNSICNAPPPPPPCTWETGNVTVGSPAVFCHYSKESFPPESANGFYCRIHATPTAGTMRGDLQVTTEILLSVGKDTGAADVLLDWTGGGLPGDETFVVVRSDTDPRFSAPTSADPTGGPTGRAFRDAGQLGQPGNRFYLVRNRQSNE